MRKSALSLKEAAEILNVSVEYMDKIIGEGKIPIFSFDGMVMILFKDLQEYKDESDRLSLAALIELSALSQEMKLYGGSENGF